METQQETTFFRRLDWSAFWTACIASFAVYLYTLAPTVSLEDSGELAVAADALGVPHPPGYPIWTMICWLFTKVFAFVPFRGQPNPAWSVGLMSAVFGALASGITALLICRSGSDILSNSRQVSHSVSDSSLRLISWVGGVTGSLLFAFTPVMWSQAVIVEVYSLNAFFLVLVLALIYVWTYRPSNKLLYATGFLFGLGLTNYQVLLLAALALVIIIMLKDFDLFRDFVIVGGAFIVLIVGLMQLVKAGHLDAPTYPTDPVIVIGIVLNFAILAAAYFLLPRGKPVAITVFLAQVGVGFYIFMPIVSDLRNPPMNWAYPRTWAGFLHAVKRGQYEKITPSDPLSLRFLRQLGVYLGDLTLNYQFTIALIGFLPFITYRFTVAGRRIRCMEIGAILLAVAFLLHTTLGETVKLFGVALYKMPAFLILVMLTFGALVMIVGNLRHVIENHLASRSARVWERLLTVLVLVGIAAAYGALVYNNLRITMAPVRAGKAAVTWAFSDPIFKQLGYTSFLTLLLVSAVAFTYWLSRHRSFDIVIDRESQKWITATQIAFVTLSIGLIALANLKMDIQDTFIQRVKFISSHALFSFWIGYGVIFLLAIVDGLSPRNKALSITSACVMLGLVATPVWRNWNDDRLSRHYGGAEQNGHDFGWQFGNYQLRGAEAISEELDPSEEPLPNPTFPPEMTQNAIFFGGTDPGRFVPTYMIYSARVREDVYLITQNALADNTFMSVTRDLYGDQIWIPAEPDSARSFQRYVEEVKTGKRRRNADLKIENGRVQVSGALGVMEINGILAQMIFEHNNYRHDFYVEESYVIQWMYPYLSPHGLIMKINAERTPLDANTIRDDQDFWDWYTRRLHRDQKFIRDIVARKSFSKLRSAIAGLYANRGKFADAELAFHQARTLYPLSPEANFRLTQEVLLRQRRIDDARAIVHDFQERDPLHQRTHGFLAHLDSLAAMNKRILDLQALMPKNQLDFPKAMELAQLYLKAGLRSNSRQMLNSIAGNKGLPAQYRFQVAQLYQQGGFTQEMIAQLDRCADEMPPGTPANVYLAIARAYSAAQQPAKTMKVLAKYLEIAPNDWKARIDMAVMQISSGNRAGAIRSLEIAMAKGGREAQQIINKDGRFNAIRRDVQARRNSVMAIPGLVPPKR